MRLSLVAALVFLTGAVNASTGPIPLNCNRACLENLVDQYLAAVVAHDPKNYFVVQNIHGRRYPVVDQERGVVWAHGVIDQGTVNSGVLSDGRPFTFNGFNRPSSILFTEAFLIENGKIRRVEMVGPSSPYHINSSWPGGLSGN